MNGGPSGFHNAPVTKWFSIAAALVTVAYGVRGRSSDLELCYEDVFGKLRLWKCFASTFAFSSTPELVFGLYLLYYFRVFERQLGSNKYAVFILFSMIVSLLLEVLLLTLIRDPTTLLISGPYGLIFSSFVQFFIGIPISLNIYIFGVRFTDKSFTYLAGVQLLLSSWKKSLLPGICGVLAGLLYHLNICYVRHLQFPECVASFPSRFPWPSEGLPRNIPSSSFMGDFPLRRVQREANYPLPAPGAPEDSVAALVAMGFDRSSAQQALITASNDVNLATNILLGVQP